MQAGRGAVEADVGDDAALRGRRVERLGVGALVDEAARRDLAQELGLGLGHGWLVNRLRRRL